MFPEFISYIHQKMKVLSTGSGSSSDLPLHVQTPSLASPQSSEKEVALAGDPEWTANMQLIDILPDEELERLNRLLPWGAFLVDSKGRRFGRAWSGSKRAEAQALPDPRILELDRRIPLRDRSVLEIGCFEGIHTAALAARAARVLACDGRIENVVKTIVRCGMLQMTPFVFRWNVEECLPETIDITSDVLHHVGVLYHLTDPVSHLNFLAHRVNDTIMLDTHVAPENAVLQEFQSCGRTWKYFRYKEGGREDPFSGMDSHAKWLEVRSIIQVLEDAGFSKIDVVRIRQERNGPRLLLFARR
ncbi:MAG: methyltransferase type 12 [Roseomonas sp.]|nr:methyltransferase type 12 [Roseomonas sp.]MCA3329531.1 methyltransferase type 12 [Roseomonas sp.]MCA3333467.1 methyltransferase type 12 [Roseomonas sp.]MCA3348082.1 methyltransferase type 12 [Roseomonas sp.]MCA3354092.1 methyltransferase type 12 [Roseomonas sp.]